MQAAYGSMEVIKAMAEIGNPNSVSDAGVGALCARAAVIGAFMNVASMRQVMMIKYLWMILLQKEKR